MQKLNVAMIGGGFMGKAHAMAYAAMPIGAQGGRGCQPGDG
jgi:hypothetical protein